MRTVLGLGSAALAVASLYSLYLTWRQSGVDPEAALGEALGALVLVSVSTVLWRLRRRWNADNTLIR
ncbi:MAG: hypothetical protein ABW220_06005 [Burkholderiaceae bacterium]